MGQANCEFHRASVNAIPLPDDSMDFGYAIGVLHHVPNTAEGIKRCAGKLKPGAPFLLYLYYAFDNRPSWFRAIWRVTDAGGGIVSRLPYTAKYSITFLVALIVYSPLARASRLLEKKGVDVESIPLAGYRNRAFYTMRNDALDRFGTRLEHRFTGGQIRAMMEAAGFERILFSQRSPYWTALG